MLTETARKQESSTQMGNQGHSGEGTRLLCEWVWDGAIGDVREAHAWTNRPVWPSGIEVDRPSETPPRFRPASTGTSGSARRMRVPITRPITRRSGARGGTSAPARSATWRCHIVDPLFWSLKLKYPVSVEANISRYWHAFFEETAPKNEMFPRSTIVRFRFPRSGEHARGGRDVVGRGAHAGAPRRARARPAHGQHSTAGSC